MRLVKSDVKELGVIRSYATSENLLLLEEFANSNEECVKIEGYPHKTATSCYGAFFNSIRRYKMTGIKVCMRGDNVYLVKTK